MEKREVHPPETVVVTSTIRATLQFGRDWRSGNLLMGFELATAEVSGGMQASVIGSGGAIGVVVETKEGETETWSVPVEDIVRAVLTAREQYETPPPGTLRVWNVVNPPGKPELYRVPSREAAGALIDRLTVEQLGGDDVESNAFGLEVFQKTDVAAGMAWVEWYDDDTQESITEWMDRQKEQADAMRR